MRSNGIPYKQYDVEKDRKARAMMKTLGGTGAVPFAIINGETVRGYSERTYKKVLGLN